MQHLQHDALHGRLLQLLPGLLMKPQKKPSSTKSMAMGGIFSALAVVLMLAGGYISIGTFAAPIFAGICLLPIALELGGKWALLCYLAVSLISAMLVPDQELVLFFIALFGYYPILQPKIMRIKNRVLRMTAKLLLFNLAVAAVYALLLLVLASPALLAEFNHNSLAFWVVLLLLANFTFILYDILLDKARYIYVSQIRNRLFR